MLVTHYTDISFMTLADTQTIALAVWVSYLLHLIMQSSTHHGHEIHSLTKRFSSNNGQWANECTHTLVTLYTEQSPAWLDRIQPHIFLFSRIKSSQTRKKPYSNTSLYDYCSVLYANDISLVHIFAHRQAQICIDESTYYSTHTHIHPFTQSHSLSLSLSCRHSKSKR